MATVPLVMVSNDCAHEKKSPYGYLFNTEKTLYKEMNLQKEKKHLTVQNRALFWLRTYVLVIIRISVHLVSLQNLLTDKISN